MAAGDGIDSTQTPEQDNAHQPVDMQESGAINSELDGYSGPGKDYPRKYVRGPLQDAYQRQDYKPPGQEYSSSCQTLGAHPNSHVKELLTCSDGTVSAQELLGGETVSLRQTYLGERGFIALLPLLDRNTRWKHLDASNNGLRNEAVLHLVDMLLRPSHAGRRLCIDLSRNPISEGAGKALMELVKLHPGIESVNLAMTKVPRHLMQRIKRQIEHVKAKREPDNKVRRDNTQAEGALGNAAVDDDSAEVAVQDSPA
jgi:hypothetical protein